jgi:hypothetical protein
MTADQALKIFATEGLAVARPGPDTDVREFRPIHRVPMTASPGPAGKPGRSTDRPTRRKLTGP